MGQFGMLRGVFYQKRLAALIPTHCSKKNVVCPEWHLLKRNWIVIGNIVGWR